MFKKYTPKRYLFFVLATYLIMLLISPPATCIAQESKWWDRQVEVSIKESNAYIKKMHAVIPYNDEDVYLVPERANLSKDDYLLDFAICLRTNSPGDNNVIKNQVGMGEIDTRSKSLSYLKFNAKFPAGNSLLPTNDLQSNSRKIIGLCCPYILNGGKVDVKIYPLDSKGIFKCTYSLFKQDILCLLVEISLQSWDGKLSGIYINKSPLYSFALKPSPSKNLIEELFSSMLKRKYHRKDIKILQIDVNRKAKMLPVNERSGALGSSSNSGFAEGMKYYWNIGSIISLGGTQKFVIRSLYDEQKKSFSDFTSDFVIEQQIKERKQFVNERWPTWSFDDKYIAFLTNIMWPEYPHYAEQIDSIGFASLDKKDYYLVRPIVENGWPSGLYDTPSFSLRKKELLFNYGKSIFQFDLDSGDLTGHGSDERPAASGTWSHDGKRICFAARRGKGDQDIFVANTLQSMRDSTGQWRLSILPGDDILPVFSPNDQAVAFVNLGVQSGGKLNRSIYVVSPDKIYTHNIAPQKIIDVNHSVERICWFPDGHRLLVSTGTLSKPILIVDTKNKTSKYPDFPSLYDLDISKKPLVMSDVILNSSGNKIAFTGHVEGDGEAEGDNHIYICNIDGSDLVRLTPKNSTEPQLYKISHSYSVSN